MVCEVAIARDVGDSVLYHSLSRFVSPASANGVDYDNH